MIQLFDNPDSASAFPVVAIGNFDGVHLGHRVLLQKAVEIAKALDVPAGVMTFEPHPRRFFQKDAEPFRLTLLPMKARLMEEAGITQILSQTFDAATAAMSADEFIDLLKNHLRARHIVVGEDFAFGKGRSGNVGHLCAHFDVTAVPPVLCEDGGPYSSTRIREHLQKAEFAAAAKLLGWEWQMEGEVVHGNKNGRSLGFPTANQNVPDYIRIPYGIYAVEASVEGGKWLPAIANFGIRPMFEIEKPLLETFIFDFDREIYGNIMRVKPLKYLRAEMKFDNLDGLVAQMDLDCRMARDWLKSYRKEST